MATRELNAALNLLLEDADLTFAEVVHANGLGLTARQYSRQMRESKKGPTEALFEAILVSAAPRVGKTVQALHTEFDPKLERARTAATDPVPEDQIPTSTVLVRDPELFQDNADWLAGLLMSNDERRAADELDERFADLASLVEALILVGARDPGMPAALLDEIGRRDFPRRSKILARLQAADPDTAQRVTAVSLTLGGTESRVLDMDPMVVFGRRLAGVIRKGDLDRACREVSARSGELSSGPHSMLGAIINSDVDGRMRASQLLQALSAQSDLVFQCLLQLVRHVQRSRRCDLLIALLEELPEAICGEFLSRLSATVRLPNLIGLESAELEDLRTFVTALCMNTTRTIEIAFAPRFARPRHAAGHLLEVIPEFAPILKTMVGGGLLEPAARLLARAITEWNERLRDWGGLPEMYRPLIDLAEAIFTLADPVPLVSYLLVKFPDSGSVLFQVMLWRGKRRLPTVIGQLAEVPVLADTLGRAIVDIPSGRRQLRVCEQLVKTVGAQADPILLKILAENSREVLRYSRHHAPRFTQRMAELLVLNRKDSGATNVRVLRSRLRSINGDQYRMPTYGEPPDPDPQDESAVFSISGPRHRLPLADEHQTRDPQEDLAIFISDTTSTPTLDETASSDETAS